MMISQRDDDDEPTLATSNMSPIIDESVPTHVLDLNSNGLTQSRVVGMPTMVISSSIPKTIDKNHPDPSTT